MLWSVTDDFLVAEQPLLYLGVALTTRMTIIRLAGGVLMIHSPIRLADDLRRFGATMKHTLPAIWTAIPSSV